MGSQYINPYSEKNRIIICPYCGKPAIKTTDGIIRWYCYTCMRFLEYTTEVRTYGTVTKIA